MKITSNNSLCLALCLVAMFPVNYHDSEVAEVEERNWRIEAG